MIRSNGSNADCLSITRHPVTRDRVVVSEPFPGRVPSETGRNGGELFLKPDQSGCSFR